MDISERYKTREKHYRELHGKQEKLGNLISNLRFLVFIFAAAASTALYYFRLRYLGGGILLAGIVLFIYLVVKHNRILTNKNYSAILADINHEGSMRATGDWKAFKDDGADFADRDHRYTWDLDIFGRGSLYQWICSAYTYTGRKKLAGMLEQPENKVDEIYRRQEAISELGRNLKWRHRLMAEARSTEEAIHDPKPLYIWAMEKNPFYVGSTALVLRMLPIATILLAILCWGLKLIPVYAPSAGILLQLVITIYKRKNREKILLTAIKYRNNLRVYEKMLGHIEKKEFSSDYLGMLKKRMINSNNEPVSVQTGKLAKIADSISNRYNMFYFVFNVLLLWDFQILASLEKWKETSGRLLSVWLDTIGEFEALSSLSNIRYEHEEWVLPKLESNSDIFNAVSMGHPLLGEEGVCNDLLLNEASNVSLITGSNMSGKSTLLRMSGINLVLAYAGAPVCARKFTCSVMEIYTCMRISDNLEMSISSFYAEILRIKMIVNAVQEGKKVFFLLDEIFKGTNSIDRHMGAKVLVNMLSGKSTLGLVSTHDLELAEMETASHGRITNYHFREYYRDNTIHFDYKLRPGVSTTRNARYLMKMAGLDI